MKITPRHLKEFGVVDDIIAEPLGGAHRSPGEMAGLVERYVVSTLRKLRAIDMDEMLESRYRRWRSLGRVAEVSPAAAEPAAAND